MTEPQHRATSMNMTQQQSPPALPLYERVEQLRLEQGWTRVRLAQVANVSRGTIDSWKTQPRPPLAPTVVAVADRLGIDQDEALRLAGIKRTVQGRMTAGPPAERHLQPVEGGGEPPAPDEIEGRASARLEAISQKVGLADHPPFPNPTSRTQQAANQMWEAFRLLVEDDPSDATVRGVIRRGAVDLEELQEREKLRGSG